ncbi:MAG: adenylate/guanylate cyclase domain-containing protein [Pyrinomonadaceae bacterium]
MAVLQIKDAGGRQWRHVLSPQAVCTIGRSLDNTVALNDPRASRYHARCVFRDGAFHLLNGALVESVLKRSANGVLVNDHPVETRRLEHSDRIKIGSSVLQFFEEEPEGRTSLRYEDRALGKTQIAVNANDLLKEAPRVAANADGTELERLRRKADILAMLYELTRTLNSVFDLQTIFDKATDIIFRVTPADRVVALLAPQGLGGDDYENLQPMAARARVGQSEEGAAAHVTISRTILRKVLGERLALLSQDAAADAEFARAKSIIMQGVRSTICAPLITESGACGVIYADRLDPNAVFTRDDLELISAIAAQTAAAVESVRAHERLAREEVARANYSRFLPEYVVRQMLEHPESFKLGGANQTVTVLFADVRGFTRISEQAPPERVVQLLNHYFSAMTDVIFAHGGTLDKYIGDGLMALFGAPASTPADAANALAAAVSMQRQMETLNAELRAAELPEVSIGIGLHTGEATVGYIGSERRSEYTAIGDTVNLASRLEARARGGQILLSRATADAAAGTQFLLREQPPITIRNRVQPVSILEAEW